MKHSPQLQNVLPNKATNRFANLPFVGGFFSLFTLNSRLAAAHQAIVSSNQRRQEVIIKADKVIEESQRRIEETDALVEASKALRRM